MKRIKTLSLASIAGLALAGATMVSAQDIPQGESSTHTITIHASNRSKALTAQNQLAQKIAQRQLKYKTAFDWDATNNRIIETPSEVDFMDTLLFDFGLINGLYDVDHKEDDFKAFLDKGYYQLDDHKEFEALAEKLADFYTIISANIDAHEGNVFESDEDFQALYKGIKGLGVPGVQEETK